MATYREIHGKAIKSLSTDPSNADDAGQIWYNTASDTFKSILGSTAWASGANQINGLSTMGSFGSQTSAVTAGGTPPASSKSEEYDGSGWSTGGTLGTARFSLAGAGVSVSSGRVFGGSSAPTSMKNENEGYNGTAWSEEGNLTTARNSLGGAGTKDAALAFGGGTGPGPSGGTDQNVSEEWNGTSWTEGNNLNTARRSLGGAGTQTAALAIAGVTTTNSNLTEEYNGASWAAGGAVPTGREGMFAWGPQTAAVAAGGQSPFITTTFTYDGSTWSTSPATMGTARQAGGSAGQTGTAGLAAGGETSAPGRPGATEEFNSSVNVITAAAFSSGGTVPQIVRGGASGGTQTTAWLTGGLQYPGDTKNKTWTYDGASWSSAEDLPNNYFIGGGVGPATAGLAWDGIGSYGPGTATYEWDGSNWTSGGAIPAIGPGGNSYTTGAGVGQTAAVAIGGIGDPPPASSDRMLSYNGASWSSDESLPAAIAGCAADGPNTAIWIAGGRNPATPSAPTDSKEYNGASWTSTGSLVTALPQGLSFQGWGPQTSAIIGGGTPSPNTASQQYNGTAWATAASMSTGRDNNAYCSKTSGTQQGFIAGGYSGTANTGATEEYNPETSALNVKTLTQS